MYGLEVNLDWAWLGRPDAGGPPWRSPVSTYPALRWRPGSDCFCVTDGVFQIVAGTRSLSPAAVPQPDAPQHRHWALL